MTEQARKDWVCTLANAEIGDLPVERRKTVQGILYAAKLIEELEAELARLKVDRDIYKKSANSRAFHLDELQLEMSRYSMDAGRADQYRSEARACRKALGFSGDDVAPIDLINAIKSLRYNSPELPDSSSRNQLKEENRQLRAGWVKCSERLPEDKELVLAWSPDWGNETDTVYPDNFNRLKITHWMPLPDPPAGD